MTHLFMSQKTKQPVEKPSTQRNVIKIGRCSVSRQRKCSDDGNQTEAICTSDQCVAGGTGPTRSFLSASGAEAGPFVCPRICQTNLCGWRSALHRPNCILQTAIGDVL